jgi:hypothetical protein
MKNKLSLFTLIGLTTLGSGAAIISSFATTKESTSRKTQSQTPVSYGKYCNDVKIDLKKSCKQEPTKDFSISTTQLNDHLNALSDKLQLSLIAAGCDADTIASTMGTYLANIENYKQNLYKTSLSKYKRSITDNNGSIYTYANQEAAKLGVSVVDFDENVNYSIPLAASAMDTESLRQKYTDLALSFNERAQTYL